MATPCWPTAPPRFDPEEALHLLQHKGITHTFLFPTALRLLHQLGRVQVPSYPQSIHSGGEPPEAEILSWAPGKLWPAGQAVLGVAYTQRGQRIVVHVKPRAEHTSTPAHTLTLQEEVRKRVAHHANPQEIRYSGRTTPHHHRENPASQATGVIGTHYKHRL